MSKSKSFKSFKEKTGLLKHILACTVLKGLLALSANFWKNHFFWITPKFTESSLKYFEYQKYCVVEMVDEMRVVIYGKDKLQKNWYLISLKRLFVTGVHSTIKCAYLLIFTLEIDIPIKLTLFWFENSFPISLSKNKAKVRNCSGNVSSKTFYRRNF